MIKRLELLTKNEKVSICKKAFSCQNCVLNIENFCILKNSKEQIENYLGYYISDKYLKKIVEVNV